MPDPKPTQEGEGEQAPYVSPGQAAYLAWRKQLAGICPVTRNQIPPWKQLHPGIRQAYEVAARAAIAHASDCT